MADNGIVPEAEVVPDHACQVFTPSDGVRIFLRPVEGENGHSDPDVLAEARDLVAQYLN